MKQYKMTVVFKDLRIDRERGYFVKVNADNENDAIAVLLESMEEEAKPFDGHHVMVRRLFIEDEEFVSLKGVVGCTPIMKREGE